MWLACEFVGKMYSYFLQQFMRMDFYSMVLITKVGLWYRFAEDGISC